MAESEELQARCAYSGELLTIEKMEGTPLFVCKGGFDPAEWISGVGYDALKRALMQRPGGKVARKMRCPYMGSEIRIIDNDRGMIRAEGAFSPARGIWKSRQEALWEIGHRNGVAPRFPRENKVFVGEETVAQSDPAAGICSTTQAIADHVTEEMKI